jgi:hypothetical protein
MFEDEVWDEKENADKEHKRSKPKDQPERISFFSDIDSIDLAEQYDGVTTGDLWRFGKLDRMAKMITEDTTFCRVPNDLSQILDISAGVLQT